MVQKRTIEVVIPQTSSQSINSIIKSNKMISQTTPETSLATVDEGKDLCSPSSLRHTDGELQTKLDNSRISSVSNLMGHFFSGAREEEKEREVAEVVYGASPPHRTNNQLECDGDNRQATATSGNRRGEEIKREEVHNTYGTSFPHRADVQVRFEQDNFETSTTSSASNESTSEMTPTSSSVDEMEGNLIDLYDDGPLRHTGEEFLSDEFEPRQAPQSFVVERNPYTQTKTATISPRIHHAPKSFVVERNPYTQMKTAAASPQIHHAPSTNVIFTSTRIIPTHEIFLHTLPAKTASVPHVRTWIASWFSGRDISFAGPWEDEEISLQQYINCISWSGHDIHTSSYDSLEKDMRGWMLGHYARPIVRDIERARNMERERRWEAAMKRVADFLYGAVVMGVAGLVLMVCVPCRCRG
ncbi:hypothetical protein BOTCAL_0015g00100 [Botryotinia calthae]|uniref:Uncharacterized protein n=1 Tax=Botryotinia calthae TaxID=38488 RepID=A0A4Y8DFW1_9HELO|nr:hypothetical protein BOTCAL_0015g00100 [Botryotinia calthae]